MESTITIRQATEADLKTIQNFGFKLLDFERKNWDPSLDPEWPFSEIGKQKYLEAIKSKYTIIAEINDLPVGYLIGKIIETPTDSARHIKIARLENIFVDDSIRQAGIGAKLAKTFQDYCKENNVTRLDVSVLADNTTAVSFYKKIGFRPRSINLSQDL